jgi:hypothetical protein
MRWYISYPILAAGLVFGAHTFFPGEASLSRSFADPGAVSVVAPPPVATVVLASEHERAPQSRLAAFSPGERLLLAERPRAAVLDYLAHKLAPLDVVPAAPVPAPQPVTASTWKSAVIREGRAPSQDKATAGDTPRVALARDIQRELKRVGCYLGDVDGRWGGGSKRAILTFMDRVNASLPTREPDVFMLSLLRAQNESVCGPSCPLGQSFTESGRCQPTTLVAQGGKAVNDGAQRLAIAEEEADATWEPVVADASTTRKPPLYGRMSIGGPKPDDADTLGGAWPGGTGVSAVTSGHLERTAALEALPGPGGLGEDTAALTAKVAKTSFDSFDAPPARRNKAASSGRSKSARAAPARMSNYRHVQRLFEHPLGRM